MNTSYLPKNHPIRLVLDQAAAGHLPTRQQLDALAAVDSTLERSNLARFRAELAHAANEVARDAASGDFLAARQYAERLTGELATRMTDDERAVDSFDPDPENSDAIAARMFGH